MNKTIKNKNILFFSFFFVLSVLYNGKYQAMDMTQKLFNSTRKYKYIQYLYI